MRRGRFAPSPSGPLHFGSLIAALGSYLDARAAGGEWLLRMEDIDTPRVQPGAADAIQRALERHGLCWDGPVSRQSRRLPLYREALQRLRAAGYVYRCSCSRREIAERSALGRGGPVYPGTCRAGPLRPDRLTDQRPGALRLLTDDREIVFVDRLQGRFRQRLQSEVGDFVLRRADRIYAYQLAVVVDDAEQRISDVVRGCDLLDSTPRQIYLQRLLGLPQPSYLHLPLAVDRRGVKLSKQSAAPALDEARAGPNLVAALAFLNQPPPPALAGAAPAELLDWAVCHWRATRVSHARRKNAPAPAFSR